MVEPFKLQINETSTWDQTELEIEFADAPTFVISPFDALDTSPSELTSCPPACVHLSLADLDSFEVVDIQFQDLGVTFSNAIALHPSNPAYPSKSGSTVLVGSPKSGWVEAKFQCPVRFVSGFVTSSRRTVLAAFDADNQPVAQTESPGANLAGSDSSVPPNVQLSLKAANIHRVTFSAFDGQLTLDDFSFGF